MTSGWTHAISWEREITLQRQREAIAKAKAEGKYKGRPVTIGAAALRQALAGGEGPTTLARRLGIDRSTLYLAMQA